jgi:hypothetical protein
MVMYTVPPPVLTVFPQSCKAGDVLCMHTNTITIFLIEITINECFISHINPQNYSLKYGKTAKFGNFRSKVSFSFIAKNPHLIESNHHESRLIKTGSILECAVTTFGTSAHWGTAGNSKDHQ